MDFRNYVILIVSLCLLISIGMNFVLLGKRITEGHLENFDADDAPEWDVDEPEEPIEEEEVEEKPKKAKKTTSSRKSGSRRKKAA